MKKAIATALMAAMMTVGTVGASFAAGLGTIDMAALLQKHPNYPKAMAQWRSDVEKAQKDFQDQVKKEKDPKAQQELAQKFNVQLNKQRIELFTPLEKDILEKTKAVKQEKGLDYVVLNGSVVDGQAQDITNDVAAKLK
ncbi:OmpH family outer membrane protein [Megasphaera sp. SW808]|uniref:OmpH family outer membrane protein n=1 Tax=Megasphaera sp. SW808 TaxID=2530045 RepID=UPI0014390818|nr:OmpH family outer membrane protein [Megasphaera sp. SW808]NJE34335.1 OmpH family outer membrane protein [Megasphaera sp. SW808]